MGLLQVWEKYGSRTSLDRPVGFWYFSGWPHSYNFETSTQKENFAHPRPGQSLYFFLLLPLNCIDSVTFSCCCVAFLADATPINRK